MVVTRERLIEDSAALVNEGIEILVREAAAAELTRRTASTPTTKKQAAKKTARKGAKKEASDRASAEATTQPLPLIVAYQSWYTKALPLVKLVLPDRYAEFIEQYKFDKRKEIDYLTYTISDYLIGLQVTRGYLKEEVVNPLSAFSAKFQHQISILRSCSDRLSSAMSDIQGVLLAELLDDELDAAHNLISKGHLRAGGALAGVTLERHLSTVAANHSIRLTKAHPTIADLNEALKKHDVLDVPTWRFIQRLADLRNLATHAKEREPTKDEMVELVAGVQKLVKTLF